MSAWVGAVVAWLLGISPPIVRTIVSGITDLIRAVFNWLDDRVDQALVFARSARAQFTVFSRYVNGFISGVWDQFSWVVNRFVPDRIRRAINSAISWASKAINRFADQVYGYIIAVRDWLRKQINAALNFARGVQQWALGHLRELIDAANALRKALVHVLGGPRRLADWLIGATVSALWRYVQRNEVNVFRWARDRSTAFTLWSAERIESIIGRLL
jgi:hypothetical protein